MKTNAVVLIGDISSSRAIKPTARYAVQTAFEKILHLESHQYRKILCSPLKLTLGDEFQGVGKTLESMWQLVQSLDLKCDLLGVKLRYALVEDKLYTPINPREPLKMDGPAFWKARELISQKKLKYSFFSKMAMINPTLNTHGLVIENIENNWSTTQKKYIRYMIQNPDITLDMVARHFKKIRRPFPELSKALNIFCIKSF